MHYNIQGTNVCVLERRVFMPYKPIKPGTDNQPAGTYHEVGPRGGQIPGGRTVHIDPGDRLPPTQKPGRGWSK
jgi:hypothetical protein